MKKFLFFAFTVALSTCAFETRLHAAADARPFQSFDAELLVLSELQINRQEINLETAPNILFRLDQAIHKAINVHARNLCSKLDRYDDIFEKVILPASKFQDHLHVRTDAYPQPCQVDLIYFYIFAQYFPEKAQRFIAYKNNLRKKLQAQGKDCESKDAALDLIQRWTLDIRDSMRKIFNEDAD
ncbi:hypothetical protein K2W90_00445 [Candidatus Babeliales bacterium]|nr:hypothetical protein [Candidatus Babeliales bacterium]